MNREGMINEFRKIYKEEGINTDEYTLYNFIVYSNMVDYC
jgi:hypothetical protein